MSLLRHISFPLLLLCLASPAFAAKESPYRGGMKNIINDDEPSKEAGEKPANIEPETKAEPQTPPGRKHLVINNEENFPKLPEKSTESEQPSGGMRKLYVTKEKTAEETPPSEEETEKKIWNRYKALAAGTAGDEEKTGTEEKDSEKTSEKSTNNSADEKTGETQANAEDQRDLTGFERIIRKYEESKQRQSQMHVIQVKNKNLQTGESADEEKSEEKSEENKD